ncbi:SIMPL domain-containing protein [Clostridium sp. KNHs205]|jgi:uncharacterized protein|uniref:SIMPL domain-containing protein n=1 Tax=Clostridium sp. KNHs205 TaxID=1449050 RepID=UPI00051C822E|nr:SIMPL domain-containing protein [Clostridium sp. KNHs205]
MATIREDENPGKKMVLTGKGQVSVNPDLAILRLGVLTTGEDVTTAQAENAKISQQVLEVLRQLGIADIKTVQYQIEKIIDYQNGNRIDRGYSVRNLYEVSLDDLGLVGTVIDTAVYNGANIIESISFEVADPDLYYQQALNLAVKNAYQKAKSISSSLRIIFDPVPVLITEVSTQPIPFSPSFALREGTSATPIESGTTKIEASVIVEFIY